MSDCRPVYTPFLKENVYTEESNETVFPYREAIGAWIYLTAGIKPDQAYAVSGFLSRKLENPCKEDWIKVNHVFRYIASSKQKCIIYKSDYKPGVLECFSNADFGGCMQIDR